VLRTRLQVHRLIHIERLTSNIQLDAAFSYHYLGLNENENLKK